MSNPDLSHLAEKWPSSVVARDQFGKFTGGGMTPGYLANLDGKGLGPPGRFRMGRKVLYPVNEVIKWLENRSKLVS
jgi:hypothetical protein